MLNKHFAANQWLVAFILFLTFSNLSAQSPNASITTWKDDRKSAYTIIHDDWGNTPGVYQYAFPIANQRGIKFSFGAITSICDDTEWAQARAMIAQGHECINHSHNHDCAVCSPKATNCRTADYGCGTGPTFSAADFATELTLSDNLILQNTGKKARFFIFPYDRFTSEANDFLANSLNYLGGRSGLREIVNEPDFTEPFYLHFYVYGPGNQTTVAQLNAAVDEAINTGSYVMREFHEVGTGPEENSWGRISVPDYTSHLNFLKTKMDANLVWSATNTEVMTYKMQREVYQPTLAFNAQTGIIAIAFAQDISKLKGVKPSLFDPSVFTTPITLKVDVTGITGALSATAFQNGVAVPYTRSGNTLLINVYPHNGVVTINSAVDPCATDTEKPVFTNCPANIALQTATVTATTAVATWVAPTATDNCGTPSVSSTYVSGAAFPIGVTTVTYNATDAKGNAAIPCSFTVTVRASTLVNCDAVQVLDGLNAISIKGLSNTAVIQIFNRNWSTIGTAVTTNSSYLFTPISMGTYIVKVQLYRVSPTGWTRICDKIFKIQVTPGNNNCLGDVEKPIFTNCPSNITIATAGTSAVATWIAPFAIDNCTNPPTMTNNFNSGANFPLGSTTVTYNAVDAANNRATPCSFNVNVISNSGLTNCDSITINGNNSAINIAKLSQTASIQIFNSQYTTIYYQTTTAPTVTVPNLKPGVYIVSIKLYRVANGWTPICGKLIRITVSAGGGVALTSANLLTLNAQLDKERVQLNWAINTGDKTDYFVVQKLNTTTGDFDNLETINNTIFTDKLREFTYFDEKVLDGETKYRIKQVFNDGTYLLSETAKVVFKTWENVTIFPNPVDDKFNLILKNYQDKEVSIYLYNSVGQPVHMQKFDANALLEVDASRLPQGHYLVRLVAKGKRDFTKQIYVAH